MGLGAGGGDGVVVGAFAPVLNHFLEFGVGLIDETLEHGALFFGNFFRIALTAEHVFMFAAFIHLRLQAHLIHQPAVIPAMQNHADAPGNGQFVGHDPPAGRRDIITARGREIAHRGDYRFFRIGLESPD